MKYINATCMSLVKRKNRGTRLDPYGTPDERNTHRNDDFYGSHIDSVT